MNSWKDTLIGRFDAAATYDLAAAPQRRVAQALARKVRALPLAPAPEVLEIGCGTGLLTALLRPALPGCRWLATDLSPGMVEACARRLDPGRHPDLETRVMDGEWPDLQERRFDLVVSSLAVQWFGDTVAGLCRLRRLLRPGGVLAATTLGAGTFAEWRRVCRGAGVEPWTPAFPTAEGLAAALGAPVSRAVVRLDCGSLGGFLDHLRLTGARAAGPGHRPLDPPVLRRLLRAGRGAPFVASYEVLTVLWERRP